MRFDDRRCARIGVLEKLERDLTELIERAAFPAKRGERDALDRAVAVYLSDLERNVQGDVAPLGRLEHLADRELVGAEALATMDQRDVGSGVKQVTYNGRPVYRFLRDTRARQTNGDGVRAFGAVWYALSAAGRKLDETAR